MSPRRSLPAEAAAAANVRRRRRPAAALGAASRLRGMGSDLASATAGTGQRVKLRTPAGQRREALSRSLALARKSASIPHQFLEL